MSSSLWQERGLKKLLFEIVPPREEAAARTAKVLGFVPLATLPGHAADLSGLLLQDLVIMELDLDEPNDWMAEDY